MDDDQFSMSVEVHGSTAVVRLTGELDVFTTARLRTLLTEQIVDRGHVHLVLDLTGLGFMDSSGLGTLVRAQRQARGLRGSFAVACAGGPVHRTMAVTGLLHVLRVYPSVDDALASSPG